MTRPRNPLDDAAAAALQRAELVADVVFGVGSDWLRATADTLPTDAAVAAGELIPQLAPAARAAYLAATAIAQQPETRLSGGGVPHYAGGAAVALAITAGAHLPEDYAAALQERLHAAFIYGVQQAEAGVEHDELGDLPDSVIVRVKGLGDPAAPLA